MMNRNIFYLSTFLICNFIFSQNNYTYYVYTSDINSIHKLEKKGFFYEYFGSDSSVKDFFSKYEIDKYEQAFPDFIKSTKILNVLLVSTQNKNFIVDLLNKYPNIYLRYDDITNKLVEPLNYYPNDYGNTSPNPNLGANVQRKSLDFINAPQAWDIEKGNISTILGFSDSNFNSNSPDLLGKFSFVNGYNGQNTGISHGTDVTMLAAARGDNAHGTVGVCMNCSVKAAPMLFGNTSNYAFTNLYKLANEGARVINMSWHNGFGHLNKGVGFISVEQDIINYLVDEFDVIFVGAAGNLPSYSEPNSFISEVIPNTNIPTGVPISPFGILYVYPASYENVLSVSSVFYQNDYTLPLSNSSPSYCCTSPWFPIHLKLTESVSNANNSSNPYDPVGVKRVGYYINQYNPDGFQWFHTLNEDVDILAPGHDIFQYSYFMNNHPDIYGLGTSYSAPLVTGTLGLMISKYNCLKSKEAISILKLTTVDSENMSLNQNYIGHLGAGRLDTNSSVMFVNEMIKPDGNAIIKNHKFNRFEFNLENINNKLTIQNVVFKEKNISNFKAKNQIHILPNTHIIPNNEGSLNLSIKNSIDITCNNLNKLYNNEEKTSLKNEIDKNKTIIYPNPNKGRFSIILKENSNDVKITIFDINGRKVYNKIFEDLEKNHIEIEIDNLNNGVYFLKIDNYNEIENIKFIKN